MKAVKYREKIQATGFTVERADGSLRDLGADTPVDAQKIVSKFNRWRILNATDNFGNLGNANTIGPGTLLAVPFIVESDLHLSQLAVFVTSGASPGNRMRMGLYRSRADGMPQDLFFAPPELITEAGNQEQVITPGTPLLLTPDVYYFAVLQNANQVLRGVPVSMQRMAVWFSALSASTPVSRLTIARPYGELPAAFPSGYVQANGSGYTPPALFVKTVNLQAT